MIRYISDKRGKGAGGQHVGVPGQCEQRHRMHGGDDQQVEKGTIYQFGSMYQRKKMRLVC